jgi:hypothetical protein
MLGRDWRMSWAIVDKDQADASSFHQWLSEFRGAVLIDNVPYHKERACLSKYPSSELTFNQKSSQQNTNHPLGCGTFKLMLGRRVPTNPSVLYLCT